MLATNNYFNVATLQVMNSSGEILSTIGVKEGWESLIHSYYSFVINVVLDDSCLGFLSSEERALEANKTESKHRSTEVIIC